MSLKFLSFWINLVALLLVGGGVFIAANALGGRRFQIGGVAFPNDLESGLTLILLGVALFGAAFVGDKFLNRKL